MLKGDVFLFGFANAGICYTEKKIGHGVPKCGDYRGIPDISVAQYDFSIKIGTAPPLFVFV